MNKITKKDPQSKSKDIVSENIEKLKQLFPEVFREGKIDFESLESLLGEYVEKDDERYSFNWKGKAQARRIAQTPSMATLRPCKEESKNWDKTENLYIEGDNLEVLKLLQKSYHKKVKMIYIDPPYNTGKDFVYKDNYKDNLKNYLELTGQTDEDGKKLSTNSDSAGRYHSNWLNMMYPRLKLARNLLKDDGVIFISIDDNEVHNLRKICDEVFGEENFVAQFPWRKRSAKSDVPNGVSQDFEWILLYKKSEGFLGIEHKRKYYSTPDFPNDRWRLSDLTTQKIEADRPNSAFDLVDPKTDKIYKYNPNRLWGITRDTFGEYYKKNKIVFPDDYDFLNISLPAYRVFESEDNQKSIEKYGRSIVLKAFSTSLPDSCGRTEDGNKDMKELFTNLIFSFPKPKNLLKHLFSGVVDNDFIVLDFFSGSATTAHAVMQLNAEDSGKRKFIMVQLPEPTDEKSEAFKAGYKNICEIGKERVRRAGEKVEREALEEVNKKLKKAFGKMLNDEKVKELETKKKELEESKEQIGKLDIGFKVFKLDSSNIKTWDATAKDVEKKLLDSVHNMKDERSEEDVLYEVLLKYGLDLTLPIEEFEADGKTIFSIGYGALIVCLADEIELSVAERIAELKDKLKPETMNVIFKDNGFKDDVVKTNTIQLLTKHGVETVRSI